MGANGARLLADGAIQPGMAWLELPQGRADSGGRQRQLRGASGIDCRVPPKAEIADIEQTFLSLPTIGLSFPRLPARPRRLCKNMSAEITLSSPQFLDRCRARLACIPSELL